MARSKGDASLARQKKGFTVQASPFNVVKFDLALILIVGVVLMFVHERLVEGQLSQLALLFGYGVAAMCWVLFRTRRVARRVEMANADHASAEGDQN